MHIQAHTPHPCTPLPALHLDLTGVSRVNAPNETLGLSISHSSSLPHFCCLLSIQSLSGVTPESSLSLLICILSINTSCLLCLPKVCPKIISHNPPRMPPTSNFPIFFLCFNSHLTGLHLYSCSTKFIPCTATSRAGHFSIHLQTSSGCPLNTE